jgi:hypothetical protein
LIAGTGVAVLDLLFGAAALLGITPSTLRKPMEKQQILFGRGVLY